MLARELIDGVKMDCMVFAIGKVVCVSRSHSGTHEIQFSKNDSMVYLARKGTTEKMSKSVTTISMRLLPARMLKRCTSIRMPVSLTIDCTRQVAHALGLSQNSKF